MRNSASSTRYLMVCIAKPKFTLNEGDFELIFRKLQLQEIELIFAKGETIKIFKCSTQFWGKEKEFAREARALSLMLNNLEINLVEMNRFEQPKKLVIFDLDSTLIEQETIDLVAELSENAKRITEISLLARKGEMDFKQALVQRVELLRGIPLSHLETIKNRLTLTDGAQSLVESLKCAGIAVAIVSSGFWIFAEHVAKLLGIEYVYANRAEIDTESGILTGRLLGRVIDKCEKENIMRALVHSMNIDCENVVAVGDGANDLDLINTAGIGIAWNSNLFVQRNALCVLNGKCMDSLKYFIFPLEQLLGTQVRME